MSVRTKTTSYRKLLNKFGLIKARVRSCDDVEVKWLAVSGGPSLAGVGGGEGGQIVTRSTVVHQWPDSTISNPSAVANCLYFVILTLVQTNTSWEMGGLQCCRFTRSMFMLNVDVLATV